MLLNYDGMPRSSFYYQLKRIQRSDKYAEIKEIIKDIFIENKKRYGYRRITLELKNRGYKINHKLVLKLMNQLGLKCDKRKRNKYNSYRGNVGNTAPNIINRNFKATKPNEKWATDVTEFPAIGNKKVYLSPILDMFNGEIISYNISLHPTFGQTMDMLDRAFDKVHDTEGIILHSDQGWQYQMKQYAKRLKQQGIIQSMSRKGNCLDNAMMENFFGLLKTEMYYGKKYKSVKQLIDEIEKYIEYYNNERIKLRLDGMSPVQYRLHYNDAA